MYKKGQMNPEKFIPISCMGPKHALKDTYLNFQLCIRACAYSSNLNYAYECIENSVNVKNVQANPEKSQKLTQHSCCSMLTLEIF